MSEVHLNLIAGQWVGADDISENRNPSDPFDLIGLYASGSPEDVARAAASGFAAQSAWFNGGPQPRADVLDKIAALIEARAVEIGTMLAREEGKILPESIAETRRAAQIFRFYAGEALRMSGEALASVRPNVDIEILRAPLGVVGLITPWNFPIAIPA